MKKQSKHSRHWSLASKEIGLSELAEDFERDQQVRECKSAADAKTRWELHLKPFFGHLRAVQVGTDCLSRYIVQRQQKGAANATINRELACLKRMMNLGAQAFPPKILRVPKFPRLSERNVRTGFVEDGEYQKLADACSGIGLWMRALFETAYNYGWRVSELRNLLVDQIDLLSGTIRLNSGETKNDEGRVVVMTSRLKGLLAECVRGKQPDDHVFTRSPGRPVKDFRIAWATICEQAGLPGLLFHDLRRTAVRNMVRSGIPEVVAMRISGHKTRAIFDRYNIVSERDLQDAARKLERRLAAMDKRKNCQPHEPWSDAETQSSESLPI